MAQMEDAWVKPNFCFQGDIRNPAWLIQYRLEMSQDFTFQIAKSLPENGPNESHRTYKIGAWKMSDPIVKGGLEICAAFSFLVLVVMFQGV